MQWPSKIKFGELERIRERTTLRDPVTGETTREGWNGISLLEKQPEGKIYPAWEQLHADPRLAVEVLFWWKHPEGGTPEDHAAFRDAIEGEEIYDGLVAIEEALHRFTMAVTRSELFGVTAKKIRAASQRVLNKIKTGLENLDDKILDAQLLQDIGEEKSGDSPEAAA
jgi:hypothetical protein